MMYTDLLTTPFCPYCAFDAEIEVSIKYKIQHPPAVLTDDEAARIVHGVFDCNFTRAGDTPGDSTTAAISDTWYCYIP